MKKKIISVLTAFCLMLIMFELPEKAIAAAGGSGGAHVHKACNGLAHDGCNHEDITYEPFPDYETAHIFRGKSYYLTDDVVIDTSTDQGRRFFVEEGVTNICLNGFSIKKAGGEIIDIDYVRSRSATLNICDCRGGGKIENTLNDDSDDAFYAAVSVINDCELNVYGGTIDGGEKGVGVRLAKNSTDLAGGTANIYGGAIKAADNFGVWLCDTDTSLNVYGGSITSTGCCAISVEDERCSVSISGGEVIGSANGDEAIYIKGENAKVTISGGSVIGENHTAIRCVKGTLEITGGEVKLEKASGSAITNKAAFVLSGGKITCKGNYAIENYGNANLTISGGTVKANSYILYNRPDGLASITGGNLLPDTYNFAWNNGTLNISGGIFGAENSGTEKYISNFGTLNLSGSPKFNNTSLWLRNDNNIGITGELTCTDPCAVYVDGNFSSRIFTNGWNTHMGEKKPSDYFKSPYTLYTVARSDDEAVLRGFLITFNANEGTCSTADTGVDDDGHALLLPEAQREKYTFDGWYTAATGGDKVTADTVFTGDTELYAHWTECEHVRGDTYVSDPTQHWTICTKCGAQSEKTDHTWDGGEVTKQPTADTAGIKTFKCTVCGTTKTETIPAAGGSTKPENPDTPDIPENPDTPVTPENPDTPDNTDNGDNPPESSEESSDSNITSPSGEVSSNNNSGSASSEESSAENSGDGSAENNGNPTTGIAVSLVPLAMALAIVTAVVNKKKK